MQYSAADAQCGCDRRGHRGQDFRDPDRRSTRGHRHEGTTDCATAHDHRGSESHPSAADAYATACDGHGGSANRHSSAPHITASNGYGTTADRDAYATACDGHGGSANRHSSATHITASNGYSTTGDRDPNAAHSVAFARHRLDQGL